ncbi:hypothetical protein DL766_008903 [Monosporascus sp. MC13-8B]|uniref:Uncharacterized protein n=1 Tax=Monosporascus cannonballus TaxID=155416 RepID=A0ABY0GTS0_9PEZI|nr:hypothetical protein DL762_009293 [Monosporascus cannonballus]RYO79502.1 hypothetical protein DL763_009242 [Monosporascus cannonballus]RYP17397.1 hypothetical protein DL766_008903 [Monosporascus sp. MC13-8B]
MFRRNLTDNPGRAKSQAENLLVALDKVRHGIDEPIQDLPGYIQNEGYIPAPLDPEPAFRHIEPKKRLYVLVLGTAVLLARNTSLFTVAPATPPPSLRDMQVGEAAQAGKRDPSAPRNIPQAGPERVAARRERKRRLGGVRGAERQPDGLRRLRQRAQQRRVPVAEKAGRHLGHEVGVPVFLLDLGT